MKRILLNLIIILTALAAGYWWAQFNHQSPQQPDKIAMAQQTYVCPMHSNIVRNHPGKCPICGMDLVLTNAGPDDAHPDDEPGEIKVDTATQQQLGVRLASATVSQLTQTIHTYATVVFDDSTLDRITPTMDGVLVNLYASRPGQQFAAGDILYEFYSEELFQHQNEYLDYFKRLDQYHENEKRVILQNQKALDNVRNQPEATRQQTEIDIRQRQDQLATMLIPIQRDGELLTAGLKYAGFSDAMLRKLRQTQHALSLVPVRAQHPCVVKDINARPGMMISAMTEILSCVDTTHAWLEIALYPDQTLWVREGDTYIAQFDDGSTITGRLNGFSPMLDPVTRTLRARIPISLANHLPIGSYASVTIKSAPLQTLNVPVSAVLRTGHGDFVMRALDKGHFAPVKVVTGIETDNRIAIQNGLATGDQVVVNGQFLLDAASSINDSAARFDNREQP